MASIAILPCVRAHQRDGFVPMPGAAELDRARELVELELHQAAHRPAFLPPGRFAPPCGASTRAQPACRSRASAVVIGKEASAAGHEVAALAGLRRRARLDSKPPRGSARAPSSAAISSLVSASTCTERCAMTPATTSTMLDTPTAMPTMDFDLFSFLFLLFLDPVTALQRRSEVITRNRAPMGIDTRASFRGNATALRRRTLKLHVSRPVLDRRESNEQQQQKFDFEFIPVAARSWRWLRA